ncbi:MAG: hypothetical protein V7607_3488 [Solirubrobacteraceae bacterium]
MGRDEHSETSAPAMFAVAASAVAAFALALALTAPDRGAHHYPQSERGPGPHPAPNRQLAAQPSSRGSRREVARVAWSFATAYLRWDAGRHTGAVAGTLRRLSTLALWANLRHERRRPTAQRPSRPDAVRSLEPALGSDGRWRAPLESAEPGGRYLGTLVLMDTAAGTRVTAVHR